MGLKLGSALLLFLPLLSLALANADVEDDSKQDLVNPPANHVGVNQAGHDLVKRGAGRGRKSCEGKRWVLLTLSTQVPHFILDILQNLIETLIYCLMSGAVKRKPPKRAKKARRGTENQRTVKRKGRA